MLRVRAKSKVRSASKTKTNVRSASKTRANVRSVSKTRANVRSVFKTRANVRSVSKTNVRSIPKVGSHDPSIPELDKYLTRVYSKYKNIDKSVLSLLETKYRKYVENSKLSADEKAYPLMKVRISPAGVSYEIEKQVDRSKYVFSLIEKTYKYATEHKLPIPETTLYIWISDSHPYLVTDIDKKFPIISFVSPKNLDYVLFPDDNFECFQIDKKYAGKCHDFDRVKAIIAENITLKKEPKVYFKGTRTTVRQSRLREDLETITKKSGNPNVIVDLDAWTSFEPLYEWSKYKWLLNLPGRYPWSNRLKWLFLMKSGVINVSVYTIGPDYVDEPYITFTDLFVKPGVDYINIDTNYNNKIRPGRTPSEEDLAAQYNENKRVYNEIIKATEMPVAAYNKMVNSAYKKMAAVNNETIYLYVLHLIYENAKVILS